MNESTQREREDYGRDLRAKQREELGHPNINPRVQLWAKKMGIDVMDLQRESPDDPMFKVGNSPWTIEYSFWIRGQFKLFYRKCHGTHEMGECCAAAAVDGRFDKWLYKLVMGGEDGVPV